MISEQLQHKIDASIKLLHSIQSANPSEVIEVAYSGGKDSDVILQLAKEAGINFRAIYKNTTIDPPGTIKHAKEMGAEIFHPRYGKSFLKLIEESGMPGGKRRICCDFLKEYKVLDKSVQGIRRVESRKRYENYKEPTTCRLYGSKENHVEVILPILEWTDEDVAEFIADRCIKCAPVYYDEKGCFHVERRLGCIGCCLKSRNLRRHDFKKYPKLLRQIIRRLGLYRATHPNSSVNKNFQDEYEQMYFDLFCGSLKKYKYKDGLFYKPDFKSYLENYFNVKL